MALFFPKQTYKDDLNFPCTYSRVSLSDPSHVSDKSNQTMMQLYILLKNNDLTGSAFLSPLGTYIGTIGFSFDTK